MATVEIKTEFNQSIEDAIDQYRNDRQPIDPKTKRKEPLLTPKRGAIVHFAVCESEIYMTTALDGANTFFLPLTKGTMVMKAIQVLTQVKAKFIRLTTFGNIF
jgi:type I restriction enzyme R subunit